MEQQIQIIKEQVLNAVQLQQPLNIVGGNSKSFYGRKSEGDKLEMSEFSGIIKYEPTELYITVKAGTPLVEIIDVLKQQGQMLAFEPPLINSNTTIGGIVATGLSGPRRPYTGSVRDFVLGIKCINGLGQIMTFGGQVMKNVAGYDLSRLLTGSLGTLGIILEISLKVLPIPKFEMTGRKAMSYSEAIKTMNELSSKTFPVSAACYNKQYLYVRFSGIEKGIVSAIKTLGFDEYPGDEQWWQELRDFQLPVFTDNKLLWRLSLPSTSQLELKDDAFLVDWGGAQYWWASEQEADEVFSIAKKAGGSATLFKGGDQNGEVFQTLPSEIQKLHVGLKQAFDPHRILNPGKMYASI